MLRHVLYPPFFCRPGAQFYFIAVSGILMEILLLECLHARPLFALLWLLRERASWPPKIWGRPGLRLRSLDENIDTIIHKVWCNSFGMIAFIRCDTRARLIWENWGGMVFLRQSRIHFLLIFGVEKCYAYCWKGIFISFPMMWVVFF